jgi:hypothetical protein
MPRVVKFCKPRGDMPGNAVELKAFSSRGLKRSRVIPNLRFYLRLLPHFGEQ